eukprot:6710851-Pyramimonas_sp.AAC.1
MRHHCGARRTACSARSTRVASRASIRLHSASTAPRFTMYSICASVAFCAALLSTQHASLRTTYSALNSILRYRIRRGLRQEDERPQSYSIGVVVLVAGGLERILLLHSWDFELTLGLVHCCTDARLG